MSTNALLQRIDQWFIDRGWTVFPFQRTVWRAARQGQSGLLHASTGSGKTYAVWFGALLYAGRQQRSSRKQGLRVLWITPMRALAADTVRALQASGADLVPDWRIEARTGDTSAAQRARQSKAWPEVLVTTPESLSLMLSQLDAQQRFSLLETVIVDEWHELMGNKRGVQVQLALARLRLWQGSLMVWGLSATLGNLRQAQDVLLGTDTDGVLVEGKVKKRIVIDSLIPEHPTRFPWGGHLGIQMLQPLIAEIDSSATSLVFTNTRSQAELWYQHLLDARPDWAGLIALHHGSLDRAVREWVEQGLKEGRLKAVVCTSSLDLGVDFLPVERVLQIGSAKGIARLVQRAGRSGHAPGRISRVTLVPTNSLELLEAAGARQALAHGQLEARPVPDKPLDVLVQHLVTIALGGGFISPELYAEVRTAWSYRQLTPEEWQWALDFVARGGQSLSVYPEYRRVLPDEQGIYRVPDAALARRHRMSIGTIVSEASIQVKFMSGGRIGSIEESFISRLRQGDHFLFGGRILEFVRVHEMTAYVRRATGSRGAVPRWQGGKMPLSSELAHAVLDQLQLAVDGKAQGPEMLALAPLLAIQQRWSALPTRTTLLIETLSSREGRHVFIYPFAGRSVHLGLASLLAYRIARTQPATFSIAVNDYGFELLGSQELDLAPLFRGERGVEVGLFATEHLLEDVLASLNATELSQRRFREIARIAGLVFQGYPGQPKSARQLQASSSLFFEVFRKHDASNLLLTQAQREVLEQELELTRLRVTLQQMQACSLALHSLPRASPFAFGLMVERFREKLTTEKLSDRVARLVRELEKAAA
ncbi:MULTISPECIES: ligase-associated DNA damage response DEXH box helicase [unclassified Janthinobacterium]|uniref:ligase-associated DNA damage response DEXH box helicase n=1 Tax=unclassified Janthinobacterium TaxID=2610881 RepID=UPI0016109ED1|nr:MULTISPECIES: ligase-associated DNA damage response DEXH box helicase [unclassified Janthinobacterium]MBB5367314.1 ATP-dependent Lhr-like helicase [Janthinobacterium sp. K2C7]MBB5380208.1 ATP-dependent Lhr-like helicase [Janthinobacterium sp. K2Li3]MBB5385696.1 ATP-dependent Lhr-like helicase [Janthinobacterium sp. K2E3]